MKLLSQLNQYRHRGIEASIGLTPYGSHEDHVGYFLVKVRSHPKPLKVIVSRFRENEPVCDANPPWNHVSVSLPNRCPTWAEMSYIKELFFEPHEVAMQLHVAQDDHVSNHEFCLHIWQPALESIPTPPAIMVGVKGVGTIPHKR